ncbi:hypothetical protein [Sphingomonas oryzagri]
MAIFVIIVVCVVLMALFFAVTIAGGRAHDRQNAERDEAERRRAERERQAPSRNSGTEI